jgi:transcriptional regulator with XRE-family HTH domain
MEIRDDLIFAALARRHVANGELQSLCEAMHLTHTALARAVLVDPAHVRRWMRGEALPTGARAVRLGQLVAGWLVVRDGSITLIDAPAPVAAGELASV